VFYLLLVGTLRVLFRVGWRPVVEGREHIPATGPLIVAANHLSFIDSVIIPLAVPSRRVTFLTKAEYFTGGGIRGWPRRTFFREIGAVPIERGEHGDAQASLDAALGALRKGWAFALYPEGTRSRDGRLYRGRTGVAWLAFAASAPVLPAGLIGTDRVQPVGATWPRIHRVRVRFGEPIHPDRYAALPTPGQRRRAMTDDIMDAIAALSGQERSADYNHGLPEA
jgi:1-acyl-sn-glycerol-3-phosphate acyltransferase